MSVTEDEVEDKVVDEGAVDGSDGGIVCERVDEERVDEEGVDEEGVDEEGVEGCSGVDVAAISAGTLTSKSLLQLALSLQHL